MWHVFNPAICFAPESLPISLLCKAAAVFSANPHDLCDMGAFE